MDIRVDRAFQTPLSNSPLLPLLILSLARQKSSPHSVQWINSEYDYIVVGGGTAGSVVASRLSELPCISVLLLEAGPEPPILTEIPRIATSFRGSQVDWSYKTAPQKHTLFAHKSKQLDINSGKMLGGNSNFNDMMYVRGNRKNFDDWAAQGAKGWSFADVFPYFLKLEDNRDFNYVSKGYHAVGGPLTVESRRYMAPLGSVVFRAATELGYDIVDSNAQRQTGFDSFQHNFRDGQRCSTVKAYLVPAEDRPNLHILLNAMVTKVIFENSKAIGVVFYHQNQFQFVKARKEVILSAGAYNTPKLLMLSGVGPKQELEKWNIAVKADLPVGKNFQDHGGSLYYFTADSRLSTYKTIADASTVEEYIKTRTGQLASVETITVAFLNGLNSTSLIDFPSNQLILFEMPKEFSGFLKPEVFGKLFGTINDDAAIFGCTTTCLQPRSRGTVTLMSANPFDPPLIDPNYLEDARDLDGIVDGLKVFNKLLKTRPFLEMGAKSVNAIPGCEMYVESEDEYLRCYVRQIFIATWHSVGTAKMGDPADPTTVVDSELRLKNLEGVRVVDASVIPIITSGNTHIPVVMVAEKASDIIKSAIHC